VTTLRTVALTAAALSGFAANSLLCRAALQDDLADASTFTTVRLLSGAAMLLALERALRRGAPAGRGARGDGSWPSAAALFAYAAAFSFAYRRIPAGAGALLLFGAVQVTMLAWALRGGDRLRAPQWLGAVLALAGVVALVRPGLRAPDPLGAALMLAAGVAWGAYSLRARGVSDPLRATAANFARAVPLSAALGLASLPSAHATGRGVLLAVLSGALASGVGYTLWYAALPALGAARASVVQLAVPLLAAVGGVALLGEAVTGRLLLAAAAIVGGVALAVARPPAPPAARSTSSCSPRRSP
jgi:drug/metabolite transporter (DMT)-like permease